MPFISAIVCSLIGGALGGFIFSNFLGSVSFLPAFAIISGCSLLATILFVAASNISPAPAQVAQASSAPKAPSKGGKAGRAKGGKQGRGDGDKNPQKPRQNKPKPKVTSSASGPVEKGEVKRFFGNKGYGFIRRENGEEVFVHYRSIEGEGDSEGARRYLKEGQAVEFVVVDTDRGPQAENVRSV